MSAFYILVVVVDVVVVVLFLISYSLAPRVRSCKVVGFQREKEGLCPTPHPRHPRGIWKTWSEGFFLLSGATDSPNTHCANSRNSLKPLVNYSDAQGRDGQENEGEQMENERERRDREERGRGKYPRCTGAASPVQCSTPPRTQKPEGHPTWISLPNLRVHTAPAIRLSLLPPHGSTSASHTRCLLRLPVPHTQRGGEDESKPRKEGTFWEQDLPTSAPRLICGGN